PVGESARLFALMASWFLSGRRSNSPTRNCYSKSRIQPPSIVQFLCPLTSGKPPTRRKTMSETNKSNEPQDGSSESTLRDVETSQNDSQNESGLRDRVHKFIASVQEKKPPTKQQLSKDRTRQLGLLIAGIVGAILLFIGIFSTPPTPTARETRGHAGPNLGRPSPSESSNAAPRP